jgi:hypothetical protein
MIFYEDKIKFRINYLLLIHNNSFNSNLNSHLLAIDILKFIVDYKYIALN